jgi:carboxymethylenebutenolidase
MKRLTANDFDQELLNLFDAYVHGDIDRRGFLEGAGKFAIGGWTAAGLLAALSPNFAAAQVIRKDDARIKGEMMEYPSPAGNGMVKAYMARPAAASGRLGAVVVVHENRGLHPHMEDIARRLAVDGFLALAPDGLSPQGGYPGDEDKARDMFARIDRNKLVEDFVAAAQFLKGHAAGNGKVGAVGFCFGGGIVHLMTLRLPDLSAAVPFYGDLPPPAEAVKVKTPLLLHFAGTDPRINSAWPAYEAALKAASASYQAHEYAGTQHGFNNDTTPRFDAAAAKLAWQRTVEFFGKHLRG